jgi:hypothetical protein
LSRERLTERGLAAQQDVGQSQVGEAKATHIGRLQPENLQGSHRFAAPFCSPTCAVGRADVPALFDPALRPGVVVAVGDDEHAAGRPSGTRDLQYATGGDRFVVWMRRNDQNTVLRSARRRFRNS